MHLSVWGLLLAYCHKCGKQNTDESKFCASCGAKLESTSTHKIKKYFFPVFSILGILIIGYIVLDIWAISQLTPIVTFDGLINSATNLNDNVSLSKTSMSSTLRFENPTFVPISFGRIVCYATYGETNIAQAKTRFIFIDANSQKDVPVDLEIDNLNAIKSVGTSILNTISGKTESAHVDVYLDFLLFKIKMKTI